MIRVQQERFDTGLELSRMKAGRTDIGGIVTFTGTVRDMGHHHRLNALTLEHYPGMTEQALAEIEAEALTRFDLCGSLIIHRYGRLQPGEDIVLVIAAAHHRQMAFDACQFLIDWLKTKAPFWKQEEGDQGAQWVDARDSDETAAARWMTGRE